MKKFQKFYAHGFYYTSHHPLSLPLPLLRLYMLLRKYNKIKMKISLPVSLKNFIAQGCDKSDVSLKAQARVRCQNDRECKNVNKR